MHSQGGETSIQDSYSRWGVKGSNEVSEGLTAVYRYEEGLDLATTTLSDNNRLSYVGLSGGFGTVTMGRIWSAAYNHVGALTDTGIHNAPNASTGSRTSNALSYSASTGPVSFQIDANMNAKEGSKRSVDMAQLGMSFDTGAAKIGLAFVNSKSESDSMRMSGIGVSVPVGGLTLYSSWTEKKVTTFATMGKPAVTASGTTSVTIPGREAVMIAEREEFTIPAQTEIDIDARGAIEVPGEIIIPDGGAIATAVAATPERCLIVRYAGAEFRQEQVLHPTSDRPLFWRTALPVGQTRPVWNQEEHLADTTTNSAIGAGDPVMRENRDVVIRAREGDSPITGEDVLGFRYATEPITRSAIDPDTGLIEFSCGANSEGTQPPGEGETDPIPFIAARIYQPAVSNVVGIEAGERDEVDGARGEIKVSEREEFTIPGQTEIDIKASGPQIIEGTVQVVLTPADPATPEKTVKTRHMHAGVSGPLGDTGMSFAVNVANHPDSKDGIGENPWNFNVSKSLGGGASLAFEYVDYDESDDNEALLRLKVDF